MGAKWNGLSLVLLAGAAVACSSDGVGPSPAQIAGTWTADELEYVSVAQPAQTYDVIAEGGTATLVLDGNGTYTLTITPNGEPQINDAGDWELDGDVMTVMPNGTTFQLQFDVALTGNTLTLTGADTEYDFGSGLEDAKLNLVLVR